MIGEGLINRVAEAIYRRGQSIADVRDRAASERREAVREVRDAVSSAMVHAEYDREHGYDEDQKEAVVAANRASSVVHEVSDEDSRRLVTDWKALFDSMPKGYKSEVRYHNNSPGWPEPQWTELRQRADAAIARLGTVLQEMLKSR